ncbi:hypothetical protein [Rhodospira trueperi]|uniref:Uncharacterized protein n=1 Tax=Rhodospira trueperi TaxID=69960 RepID=A0A1G7AVH8_9PROT|nr:hypothetical protein [Rhodospira trueperi]SDE18700.1 hypothetical protein SAMN05421720_104104 [Rhodospira trueperi]
MDLTATGAALAGVATILAVAVWRVRQPWRPGRLWRIPWNAVMALALVALMGLLAHLVSLLTGQPIEPRALR